MSKKQLTLEIYSLADFQNASRIDRIRMSMVEPDRFVLGNDDEDYYRQLMTAWHLVSNECRESVALRLIQNEVDGAESWYKANRILRDVEELFAPFMERNRELQRRKVIDRLYAYADIADKKAICKDENGLEQIDKDWIQLAQKFLKDAAEMEGLSMDGAPPLDPDDFIIPEVEITSDPSAFIEAEYQEEDELPEEEDEEDE